MSKKPVKCKIAAERRTSIEHPIFEKLKRTDTNLYNIIIAQGVRIDTPQIIRWHIIANDRKTAQSVKVRLGRFFSAIKYFSKFSIEINELDTSGYYIVVYTPDFFFSIDNVLFFSKRLFEISLQEGAEYDSWELETGAGELSDTFYYTDPAMKYAVIEPNTTVWEDIIKNSSFQQFQDDCQQTTKDNINL